MENAVVLKFRWDENEFVLFSVRQFTRVDLHAFGFGLDVSLFDPTLPRTAWVTCQNELCWHPMS